MKSAEPSLGNGGVHKPPPYPVEPSMAINNQPAPPDARTADLVSAVQYGYYDRVVELIEPYPSLASTPVNGNITLLHWAAINNHVEIAKYLISKRADVNAFGGELNSTPLHWAIRDGVLEMVVFLLSQQAQPSLFDGEGYSALHLASMFGHTEIVAYLIAKGENIDLLDKHGMTPLMHSVSRSRSRDPTQLLIRLGSQVNYQNPTNKCTPLHYAIMAVNREAIRILLQSGAHIDIRNADNETAYDVASRQPESRYLTYLLTENQPSNSNLPKYLQFSKSSRRLGTKLSPYLLIFFIAFIFQWNISLIYKGVLCLALFLAANGYMMIFFDNKVDRYLPISIAQASIFWLYVCYFYYLLPYVHFIPYTIFPIVICTYLSWSNYYLAEKCDPGFIHGNRDQVNRTICQLVEQNLFDYSNFCTACLIRRPLRSKHCKECQRCVSKFDHHCPWIDNCVGEKNLRYFTGFLFFTPICLALYLYGAYLYYRDHCHLFSSESILQGLSVAYTCTPAVLFFTGLAFLHITWISGLCLTILYQIASGYTTNEKMNFWRYKYLRSATRSPFSFGIIQNMIDLLNRSICGYAPVLLDWSRIYSLDDFYHSLPARMRQRMNLSSVAPSTDFLNV
ncbi:unnamed protein product [Adineta ricciae]|uniref:Palmitoyltransferase n=1 Tax=Adineta ricciae TaxID=249248 RepID=A0A814K6L1_ADIRI|nr:unnamed protein product [Adineta ricciae]CAF1320891.1 unnamed protein product [Adineta ricciae]